MNNWKALLLGSQDSIQQALAVIDAQGSQFALVSDPEGRLLGVVTDGNIRRGLLSGCTLQAPATQIMNTDPFTVGEGVSSQAALSLLQEKDFTHIPILGTDRRIVGIWSRKELLANTVLDNPVVLMAGGLGTRLGELTRSCPKPMLPVGGKPILEIVLRNLAAEGFRHFFNAVNYLSEMIEQHFGNGESFGVQISYLREEKRLGTAGALSLLPQTPTLPLLILNADILTRLNTRLLLQAHMQNEAVATMVVKEHELQVPYGVVDSSPEGRITAIREKPVLRFPVSAGINVLSPAALEYIPNNTFFDMPELFRTLVDKGLAPQVYVTDEYWLDIGRQDDYSRAGLDFQERFAERH